MHHLHRRYQAFRHDQRASRLKLPGRESITHHGIEGELERAETIQEFFLDRLQQREVCFVIDHLDFGGDLFSGLSPLKFDVIFVCDQVRRDQHAALRQNRAKRALGKGRLLLPGPKVIVRLAGDIYPHERKLLLHAGRGREGRFFLCEHRRHRCE